MTQTRRERNRPVTASKPLRLVDSSSSNLLTELTDLQVRTEFLERRVRYLEEKLMTLAPEAEYITITEAAERFEPHDEEARRLLRIKIQHWVSRGQFTDCQRGSGPGPNGQVLVNIDALDELMRNPPKRGPKPKSVKTA